MRTIKDVLCTLLKEACGVCKKANITYIATDYLGWCAVYKQPLPGDVLEYAIAIAASDMDAFVEALQENLIDKRSLSRLGDGSVRYAATDSTLIELRKALPAEPCLAVMVKPLSEKDGAWSYNHSKGKVFPLPKDPRADISSFAVRNGLKVNVSKPGKGFAKAVYKGKKAKYPLPIPKKAIDVIVDPNMAFNTFFSSTDRGRVEKVGEGYREYLQWRSSTVAPLTAKAGTYAPAFDMVAQRYRLCEKYMPLKKALLFGWDHGFRDDVNSLMKDYVDTTKTLYPKAVAHFDDEMFDLLVKVLREREWKYADALWDKVPENQKNHPLADKLAAYLA